MPDRALPYPEPELSEKQLIVPRVEAKTPKTRPPYPLPSTSREILYETPKQGYDDVTEEVQTEEEETDGTVASPETFFRHTIRYLWGWRAINDW